MRMDLETGAMEPFGRDRMEQLLPAGTVKLLTFGSFQLFAGQTAEGWLLRVCQIPTRLEDENHRRCFIHLAFEDVRKEPIDGLSAFVLGDYARFSDMANRMIAYTSGGYEVNRSVLRELMETASRAGHGLIEDGLVLTPGPGGEEAFFEEFPSYRTHRTEIRRLPAIDEEKLPAPVRKDEKAMKLYLYFSSPLYGYAFACVEPGTGETVAVGKQAGDMLDNRISNMVINAGMSMALFRAGGKKMNLVVKKISTKGKDQRMALVIEDGEESLTRALAACALYRNEELCDAVAACVNMDSTQETDMVNAQAVRALLEWGRQAEAPQNCQAGFDRIRKSGTFQGLAYVLLVVDPTLEYFNRMMGMSVNPSMVGILMKEEKFREFRKNPAAEETMLADLADIKTPGVAGTKENGGLKKGKTAGGANKPGGTGKPVVAKEDADDASYTVEFTSDDSIDLLRYKWFLPAVIGVLAALVLVIVLGIGSLLSKKEEPVQVFAPTQEETQESGAEGE